MAESSKLPPPPSWRPLRLYCLPTSFSNFAKPPPQHLTHCSFCCLVFLAIILWIYTCQALLQYSQINLAVCFMQQGVKFTGFLLVVWFDIIHTQRRTAHTGVNILTQSCKYILSPPVMCSQQLSVLHWKNNLLISKFTLQSSTKSLVKGYLL